MQTPAPFEYERATSVQSAIAALQSHGPDARIIAGGHSLLPMMKLRLANPAYLIDINDLEELAYIREADGEIHIGALTRHADLLRSELLAEHYPVFRDAETVIADPVVRNRGTIGGSLCQADAAEDLSAVCAAVKASVVIQGADASRTVPMDEFHLGPYMTAVGDGEMLTEIRATAAPRRRQRSREGRAPRRRLGDRRRLGRGVGRRAARSPTAAWRSAPWADHDPPHPSAGSAARVRPRRRSCSRRRARWHRRTARPCPTAADRSTTSATLPAC